MAAHIRVLVAEDDPAARRLLSEALPRLPGLSLCGVAADGLECLALIDQLRPDAVLLDLVMPGLMAAVIVTVVGGNILCYLIGGKKKDRGSGSGGLGGGSSFNAPPNSLARRY